MHSALSHDTPENWDAASRGYASKVAPALMEAFADELVDRLDVDAGTEALEVGTGSGALSETLSRRVKSLLATDFSPQMAELLRARMQAVAAANVTVKVMDGQALDVPDAAFDRAACSFALMLFPDRAKGFRELRRALRPGGRAVVSGWAGPDKFEALGLFVESMRTAFPDLPPGPTPPVFSLANPADFRTEMEAAGFSDVEVEFVTRELEVPNFDAMWEILTTGAPPVQVLFDRVGTGGRDQLRDVLGEIVEQRFGSGPIRLSNTATVGHGSVG